MAAVVEADGDSAPVCGQPSFAVSIFSLMHGDSLYHLAHNFSLSAGFLEVDSKDLLSSMQKGFRVPLSYVDSWPKFSIRPLSRQHVVSPAVRAKLGGLGF